MQQRLLISGGLHKQIITAKLKPTAHREMVVISAKQRSQPGCSTVFIFCQPGYQAVSGAITIPFKNLQCCIHHTDDCWNVWMTTKYGWVLRLCRWKHRNVWLCCIIALIPVIQSLPFPARRNIKTPLHGQRLMQKQRFTFQIFFTAPSSVYCSSKYHLHIPFQSDSYHKRCVCFPPFRSQLNVTALGLFLA